MSVKITTPDTPEKFRPLAEEGGRTLTDLLRELAALEDKSFVQYTRLCRKGRVVEFQDGVKKEFTDTQAWKAEMKTRFAALLDPHCTDRMITQRRDCLHAESYPSSFDCLNTGCTLAVTVKSDKKAVAALTPDEGGVPYNMTDPDVRYMVEDMRRGGHSAMQYDYFQKFRFVLKREGESWKLDEVAISSLHRDNWRREYYF